MGIIASLSIVFSSLETSNLISVTLDEKKIPISDVGSNLDKNQFKRAPDLVGIAHYINTTPEQLAREIEGKKQVEEPGLYNIITSEEAETHTLEIQVLESGFEMYTFTFG